MTARDDKNALDLVEEAFYLLRNAPTPAFAAYCVGTLPFLLAFLFFWADMGRSATAYDHAAPAALGVAALYVWMSIWQAVFAQALRSTLTGSARPPLGPLAFVQAALQPTKLIVVPAAVLLTFPLGAVFAFYQNLTAVSYEESRGLRQVLRSARRQARLWHVQNWVVLGFLSMLAVAIFLNIGVLLLLVPQLLKTLFGIETALARSQTLMLNSTFLAIAGTLTYAMIDPLIKAIYVLRCFYGESLGTGEDLKAQLKTLAAQIVLVIAVLGGTTMHAQQPQVPAPTGTAIHDLDRSIDDALKRPEFAWRLPHRREATEQKNWVTRMLNDFFETLDNWLDQLTRWLHERFRPEGRTDEGGPGMPKLQVWIYGLTGFLVLIVLILFVRLMRRRPPAQSVAEAVTPAAPDVASENATADHLPPDEWLRTARECVARNELRLAVRALYLANLSYLGRHSLIAIDRGKSNHDYVRELRRRARSKPEIVGVFGDTIGVFERSWYGMYDVDSGLVARVEENLSAMRAHVEQ